MPSRKELGRFLNTDEAIAMGALYQAAELSKGFKVKPFRIQDIQIQPIQVSEVSDSSFLVICEIHDTVDSQCFRVD